MKRLSLSWQCLRSPILLCLVQLKVQLQWSLWTMVCVACTKCVLVLTVIIWSGLYMTAFCVPSMCNTMQSRPIMHPSWLILSSIERWMHVTLYPRKTCVYSFHILKTHCNLTNGQWSLRMMVCVACTNCVLALTYIGILLVCTWYSTFCTQYVQHCSISPYNFPSTSIDPRKH